VADMLPGSTSPDDFDQIHRWERAFREAPDRYGAEPSAAARATFPILVAANVHELLELGAGQGRDALYFAASGLHVTAVDFTTAAAETLVGKAVEAGLAESLSVCRHDVRDPLPFDDGFFDACYSHMLFCMALDEAELVGLAGEIRRILRPGGICVYTARTTEDPDFGKGTQLGEDIFESGGFGVHFFDSELVARLAAGYTLLEVEAFEEGSLPRRLVRVTMKRT